MSNESMVHARNTRSLDFFGNIIFNLYKYKVINDEKTINLEYDKKNYFNVFFPFSPILSQLNFYFDEDEEELPCSRISHAQFVSLLYILPT